MSAGLDKRITRVQRLLTAIQQNAALASDRNSTRNRSGTAPIPPLELRFGHLQRLPEGYGEERHVVIAKRLSHRGAEEWVEFQEMPGPGPHSARDRGFGEHLDIVFVAAYDRRPGLDP